MPKAYPPEFRRRALDLIQAGRSVVQVAADLGISQGCLYSWRKQELIDTGQLPGLSSVQSAELTAARRRIRELEAENEILRRASLAFKDVVPPKDRFGLVADLAGEGFSVQQGCRVLAVSEAGYYEWRHRAPSERAVGHAWLTDQITEIHVASRGVSERCECAPNSCTGAASSSGTTRSPRSCSAPGFKAFPTGGCGSGRRALRPRPTSWTAASPARRVWHVGASF